ncbi:phage tail-collar fiber domain-containing protein [Shewanella psychrotolerans]|uniref:phage tail-collar fiber domain-containing protein n=1 Tax=Shewanella psychrotolerans TaxID=2864206 RepID=UPI001C6616B9|nr:phage tail protein [Shewanella psychrotolerans]QYK02452.1 phage tail protein [Shewanella psychrotolerans]
MARLTTTGQSLIAAAVGSGPKLNITKFVFANIPELDHTDPEPADEPMPAPENVVFERAPTKAGIIDENRVTYSQMMLTDVGDFEFNWIGLVYTDPDDGDQLVMFAYVPLTQKLKTQGQTAGNVLTRNMVIEHLGIANATPVVVSAESWMFDFSTDMSALNQRVTLLEERTRHLLSLNPDAYTCTGLAKLEIVVFDSGESNTVLIDSDKLKVGDLVEVQKMNKLGRIDINGTKAIELPDGTADIKNWLPAGKCGVMCFECVAPGRIKYKGGY